MKNFHDRGLRIRIWFLEAWSGSCQYHTGSEALQARLSIYLSSAYSSFLVILQGVYLILCFFNILRPLPHQHWAAICSKKSICQSSISKTIYLSIYLSSISKTIYLSIYQSSSSKTNYLSIYLSSVYSFLPAKLFI